MPRIQGRPPHWLGLTVILSIIIQRIYNIRAVMDGQASLKTQSGGRRTENREQMTEDRGQSEKLKAEGRPAVTHSLLCARGPGRITVFRWPGASVVVTLFINQTTSPKHRPPPSPIFRLPSSVLHLPSPGTQGPGTNTQNERAGKPAPYKQRPCGAFSVARSAIKRSLRQATVHPLRKVSASNPARYQIIRPSFSVLNLFPCNVRAV